MDPSYLWEKLGALIQSGLRDENVFEVMLNPDGQIWFSTCEGAQRSPQNFSYKMTIRA